MPGASYTMVSEPTTANVDRRGQMLMLRKERTKMNAKEARRAARKRKLLREAASALSGNPNLKHNSDRSLTREQKAVNNAMAQKILEMLHPDGTWMIPATGEVFHKNKLKRCTDCSDYILNDKFCCSCNE